VKHNTSGENHPLTPVRLAPRHAPQQRAHAEQLLGDRSRDKARSPRFAVVAVVAACAALGLTATALPSTDTQHRATVALTTFDYGVLSQLNHVRTEHGLTALHLNLRLSESADEHSREMGADGYFAHASFDGTTYWKRIEQWYPWSGYPVWSVGENLLWMSPDLSPATALKMWMNSPEHRANILTARWRQIGVSALHVASAPGVYHGLAVTIITTDFGVRH
jgi:uncharacterized protein YkwD